MSRHYDVLVVGGRLSATIAAALLAKRGLRTLLVDQGELASQDPDLPWDLVPSPAGSGVMEKVHAELGIRLDADKRLHPVQPSLQVIFPDQRFELHPLERRLVAELARERAGQAEGAEPALARIRLGAEAVGAFLAEAKELPASGFFGKRAAGNAVRRHATAGAKVLEHRLFEGAPGELAEALLALLPFITHLDARSADELTVARLSRPVARWLRGLGRLDAEGGLRTLFLEAAARRAFEIHRGAVARLEPDGKVLEVSLAQGREEITADCVLDASTDLSGIATIPAKKQKKELTLTLQAARPKGALHVLGFEVDEAVIPPGMGRYVILLNGRRDPSRFQLEGGALEDRPILLVRRAGTKPGRQELIASHPVSEVRAHAEGLDLLEASMRARVERLVPFLAEGNPVIRVLSGRGATRDQRSVLPHPLYDPELDPELGLTGVGMRTPHKNLFLAGPAVLPGLGVEGEYWTALQAADAISVVKTGAKVKKHLLAS